MGRHCINRVYVMFKSCVLIAVAFCALCILPLIAAKDTKASVNNCTNISDAAFWNWKNNISHVRKFTYWTMPLALYPRCAGRERGA